MIYSRDGNVLLMRRADHENFWQSVTGSMNWEESSPLETACREVTEETGLETTESNGLLRDLGKTYKYDIYPQWKHRYAPGVNINTEHSFALELPAKVGVTLNPDEHCDYVWLDFQMAFDTATSWSNKEAILDVWQRTGKRR